MMLRRESVGLSGPENRRHQHQEQKLEQGSYLYISRNSPNFNAWALEHLKLLQAEIIACYYTEKRTIVFISLFCSLNYKVNA